RVICIRPSLANISLSAVMRSRHCEEAAAGNQAMSIARGVSSLHILSSALHDIPTALRQRTNYGMTIRDGRSLARPRYRWKATRSTEMAIPPRLPTTTQVLEIAKAFGMTLTEEDAVSFRGLMSGSIASYARLDELAEPKLPVKYPRDPGYRPPAEENPYNAWYWKTHITGAKSGILAGERVAVKDNICVAGVPMMNGSRVLEGYVPEIDATVVTRVLDAGGVIAGKAACEDLCFSAGSHTCATGPIRNPHNPKHSTGGSSGGSAALVAAGALTMALGGDQGGSIRTPSAWCGVFGLKPTWGLVPMTGGMPISYSVDHCGPICSSTENVAKLLTAIAGPDPHDPRTINAKVGNYIEALGAGVKGLRIGLLKEGFNHPVSDKATSAEVRAAAEALKPRD